MKIIGSRRISSLPCSGRLSIQRLLARPSLPRSLTLPLRVMLLALTLFFSFTSLLFSSPVSALNNLQTTATATFHPLFPTATPGIGGLDCPDGAPLGWGTVTPNPSWSVLCGGCVPTGTPVSTGTPFPTPEWMGTVAALTGTPVPNGTGTPVPNGTGTPVPNGTGTPVPNVASVDCLGGSGFVCTKVDSKTLLFTIPSHANTSMPFATWFASGADGNEVITILGTGVLNSDYEHGWVQHLYADFSSDLGTENYSIEFPVSSQEGGYYNRTYFAVFGDVRVVPHTVNRIQFSHTDLEGSWGYLGFDLSEFSFMVSVSDEVIPTPTPDPGTLSYCSIVDDSSDTSSFGLPIITGGTPVCGGTGGFILPFSWFQIIGIELDDLIVPYIEVCFVPTSFGVLTIADNAIDLDILAYILGALFLLSLVV